MRRSLFACGIVFLCLVFSNPALAQVSWKHIATVSTLTANQLCYNNGTQIICDATAPTDSLGLLGLGSTSPIVSLDMSQKTDALALPVGSTGNRPTGANLANGEIRYNSTTPGVEAYVNGSWANLLSGGSGTANYVARWTGATTLGTGTLYDNGTQVGIGTTTPNLTLHVAGTAGLPATSGVAQTGILRLQNAGGTGVLDMGQVFGGGSWLQATDKSNLANAYNLLLDPNGGNVGIGTTSPQAALDVSGYINASGSSSLTSGPPNILGSVAGWKIGLFGNQYAIGAGTGTIDVMTNRWFSLFPWGTNPAVNAGTTTPDTNATISLNAVTGGALFNGNVGIGTTSPGSTLQVNGAAAIGYSTSTAAPTNGLVVSGNVGIGTTSSANKLTVWGPDSSSSTTAFSVLNSSGTALLSVIDGTPYNSVFATGGIDAGGGFYIPVGQGVHWDNNLTNIVGQGITGGAGNYLQFSTNNTARIYINNAGNVGIGTTSPTQLLDVNGNIDAMGSGSGYLTEITNAGTTGTTVNALAKLNTSGNAVITTTSDTDGVVGVVVGSAGLSGNAQIAVGGQASCVFDGATTAGDYVTLSSTTGGDCHDAGATRSTSAQTIGRVLSTNSSSGTYAMTVKIDASATASGVPTGTGLANYVARWLGTTSIGTGTLYDNGTSVGIGTTSPSTLLHLLQSTNTSSGGILIQPSNLTGGNIRLWSDGANARISGNSGETTNILLNGGGTGYVGIGTTSPQAPLQIGVDSSTTPGLLIGGGTAITDYLSVAGGRAMFGYDQTTGNLAVNAGYNKGIEFLVSDPGNGLFLSGTTAMYIGSSGNVGIGTTSPSANFYIYSNSAQDAADIRTYNGTVWQFDQYGDFLNNGFGLAYDNNISNSAFTNSRDTYITSGRNSATAHNILMLPSGSGSVGVGTTSPVGTLDVEGGTAAASSNGASIKIVAQSAGSGNQNGGNIVLTPGAATGTGTAGGVAVGTSTVPTGVTENVNGLVKVAGTGSEPCTAAQVGSMRYNPTGNYFELCSYP